MDGCSGLQTLNLARSAIPAMDGHPRVPGATTSSLINEQLPSATALLRARNRDANPRNDVEVITVTVGGNDIFGPVLNACGTPTSTTCYPTIGTEFARFANNYSHILSQLRQAAGPETEIVTMTYYNPLPSCRLSALAPLGDMVLEGAELPGGGLNGLIRTISQQHGARVANTFGVLGTGDFVGDCLHPSKQGHTKIAAEFTEALAS